MNKILITLMVPLCFIFTVLHSVGYSAVYFSPADTPIKELINIIDNAEKHIFAAVYMLTDKRVALALIKAKKERKVNVQIITDKISAEGAFGKGQLLAQHGIPVYVFQPPVASTIVYDDELRAPFYKADAIMHHKFALIDNLLLTGSFNWTNAANAKNRENLVVLNDKNLHAAYKKEFETLKGACKLLATPKLAGSTIITRKAKKRTNKHQVTYV